MSITRKYSLSAVLLNDAAPKLISGITTLGLGNDPQVDVEATSGEVYPRWTALTGMNPRGQFATYHLGTALGAPNAIGLAGLSIAELTSGLELYLQAHVKAGTRGGAGAHRKYKMVQGLIVPRTLSCAYGGDAVLSVEIISTWDGSGNHPYVISEAVNLPTAEADDERYTLGPVTLESKTLAQVQQFDLDFGINVVAEGGDSDPYPTFVSIESTAPTLTLRGNDPQWEAAATAIPSAGLAITHANTAVYLRKRTATGFVSDIVAQHIKFTLDGLAYVPEPFEAAGTAAAGTTVVVNLRHDGTNLPLLINAASTIT